MKKSQSFVFLRTLLITVLVLFAWTSLALAATSSNDSNKKKPGGDGIGITLPGGSSTLHPGTTGATDASATAPSATAGSSNSAFAGNVKNTTNSVTANSHKPAVGTTETNPVAVSSEASVPEPVVSNIGLQTPTVKMKVNEKTKGYKKASMSPSMKRGLKFLGDHWKNYDTGKYYTDKKNDCTNYASQYMRARGYKKTKAGMKRYIFWGTDHNTSHWFCKKKSSWGKSKNKTEANQSSSWSNVNDFWRFWVKHGKLSHIKSCNLKTAEKKARLGDIIQFKEKKGWFHTAIISRVNKHGVYYSCHTADHLHKALRKCNDGRSGSQKITKFRIIHLQKRKL